MATKDRIVSSAVAEFVKLGYGDCHDLPVRSLDFRTEGMQDFGEVAECLRVIGRYNAFDAESVIAALEPIFGCLSSVNIGRECSPVIYAIVPHWTHQRIDFEYGDESRPHSADEMCAIALLFLRTMATAKADELSVVTPEGHLFFETRDARVIRGAGTIAKLGDEKPYRVRVWWD